MTPNSHEQKATTGYARFRSWWNSRRASHDALHAGTDIPKHVLKRIRSGYLLADPIAVRRIAAFFGIPVKCVQRYVVRRVIFRAKEFDSRNLEPEKEAT